MSAAATLAKQIRRIGGGRPCLVVAHSMGGVVATAAAEAAPELFAGLVYVCAYAPVSGLPAAAYARSPENAGEMTHELLGADPSKIGGARIDTGDVSRHDLIRETFYNDLDVDTATAAISLLSTDGPAGLSTTKFEVTKARYGAIPHAYVMSTRGNVVRNTLQHRLVKRSTRCRPGRPSLPNWTARTRRSCPNRLPWPSSSPRWNWTADGGARPGACGDPRHGRYQVGLVRAAWRSIAAGLKVAAVPFRVNSRSWLQARCVCR